MKQDEQASNYIACALVCRGLPFYGFEANFKLFYKFYISSPSKMNQIVAILQSGAALGQAFNVYEAHVPFLSQFQMDYNVYGMGKLEFSGCKILFPLLT